MLAIAAPAASADPGSLYRGPGPRPGPSILYRKPATAPQLENKGPWRAKPILVSGTSAYRGGEFLYQDFLYDDHGARGTRDPGDPRLNGDTFSAPNGTYTYPTDPAYADNAADLVELRVKPLARATAFRITLDTMKDPSLVATTIAIGGSKAPRGFPFGANVSAPAKLFLTVHGTSAELDRAASGAAVKPAPTVSVSKRRRQIQVLVPHRAWDPGARRVRLAAGVGLWDPSTGRYLIPGVAADAAHPGGAGGLANPPAFFNVAFRYGEPWPDLGSAGGAGAILNPAWWRDQEQAARLAAGNISAFHANVDFGKLERGIRDDGVGKRWGAPRSGPMDRILASHFATEQGADYSTTCTKPAGECLGELRGRLQPYAIYVPAKRPPRGGYGLTLLLHSLAANYNQFSDSHNQSQFGDRGPGSIVITPEGRGPDGWYYGQAGADTFEVWADVARHFHLDPRWADVAGYSMGGYGTYKFATQYPDLFARAQPTVGPPGLGIWVPPGDPIPGGAGSNTNRMLASVRNLPFLIWDGALDELVPVVGPEAQAKTFDDLGYRYRYDLFGTADHLALAANDQYAPAAAFLGTAKVDRNPFHVTYVVNPTMSFAADGTVADHAYWLSGLRLRDSSGAAPLGEVDAVSEGFGRSDPVARPTQTSAGTLTGGARGPMPYTERSKSRGPAGKASRGDVLRLTATNLSRVVVNPRRAKLDCDAKVRVKADGPLDVELTGCARTLHFGG